MTDAGSTGRKLVFCWRSCSQVRHAGGTCGAMESEGGSPLSRDGAILYSRSPEGVVIGVSWLRSKMVIVRTLIGGIGVIRLMGLDDVSIGVCLTGWLWFAGKPKMRRWVFVRLVGTPTRALCFWS